MKIIPKHYYLITVNHKPEGICPTFETAQACAGYFAKKYNAKEIDGGDIYLYEDENGKHLITIEPIKRLRVPYNLDED